MIIKALVTALAMALAVTAMPLMAQTEPEAVAPVLPVPESETLSDFSRALDPTAEGRIVGQLQALREATGVQVVVVTLPRIGLYGGEGMRLDAYAKALFNAWGIGDAERNDGILMLVETEAREVRIALGSGYDAVYDGRAARVLSTAVLPELREGRLATGIEAGIAQIGERLITPFQEGRPVSLTEGFEEGGLQVTPWALGGLAAVGGVLLVWRSKRAKLRCPRCGESTLKRVKEVIEPPSRDSAGTGIEHQTCSSCGYVNRRSFSVRRGSRSDGTRLGGLGGSSGGGSNGSGFGGGRSSGGGASGKW